MHAQRSRAPRSRPTTRSRTRCSRSSSRSRRRSSTVSRRTAIRASRRPSIPTSTRSTSARRRTAASEPVRTCAGCGRRAPQHDLQRFHAEAGVLVPGAGPGRGVYTCRRLRCFERARAQRGFNRVLRRTVRVDAELARLYT
ncbi:MAG: YlxR family protein [Actinobacteria bacterium]|nr:YlxR family protein [Actinomycetota bacterium]